MTRTAVGRDGGTLSQWLETQGIVPADAGPGAIADVEQVRARLIEAARAARSVSYSELLGLLGHRFTRPKMRALCRTLDTIDRRGEAVGEPPLAVLVVRENDRLPGQGWWHVARARGYGGSSEGADALAFVEGQQRCAFAYWRARVDD